jgi:hypothetical protein
MSDVEDDDARRQKDQGSRTQSCRDRRRRTFQSRQTTLRLEAAALASSSLPSPPAAPAPPAPALLSPLLSPLSSAAAAAAASLEPAQTSDNQDQNGAIRTSEKLGNRPLPFLPALALPLPAQAEGQTLSHLLSQPCKSNLRRRVAGPRSCP